MKEDKSLLSRIMKKKTIWDEIKHIPVDTQKLEHLFESRAKEIINKVGVLFLLCYTNVPFPLTAHNNATNGTVRCRITASNELMLNVGI